MGVHLVHVPVTSGTVELASPALFPIEVECPRQEQLRHAIWTLICWSELFHVHFCIYIYTYTCQTKVPQLQIPS